LANKRIPMRHLVEILRRFKEEKQGVRAISRALDLSPTTVARYLKHADSLPWPLPDNISLEKALGIKQGRPPARKPEPDWGRIGLELRSHKGVTLQLLWEEYRERDPQGYSYSQFCARYRQFQKSADLVMRQEYRAGEVTFVDFAGCTVPIRDPRTGETVFEAQIFVGVLGCSHYTYCEAVPSQALTHWISVHVRMFEFFGGCSELLTPDNLKSGVSQADRYEPLLNDTYREMAHHYRTTVLTARVRRPRDKSRAELGVQVVTRWVLAVLRKRRFFSLEELNAAIRPLLTRLNERPFKKLEGSRSSLFRSLDQPALIPLPMGRYECAEWKNARVHLDYHVELLGAFYSVPYQLVRQEVSLRWTDTVVEIFHGNERVASHSRAHRKGEKRTEPLHMPSTHRVKGDWTPERFQRWGASIGPETSQVIMEILSRAPHPEQAFRSCLGILHLSGRFGPESLEAACRKARTLQSVSYRSIHLLLKNREFLGAKSPSATEVREALPHDNLRGPSYYRADSDPGPLTKGVSAC